MLKSMSIGDWFRRLLHERPVIDERGNENLLQEEYRGDAGGVRAPTPSSASGVHPIDDRPFQQSEEEIPSEDVDVS